MELQTGLVTPQFDELDSEVYKNIVKQLENQRSTINLLHLQLKKQGNPERDQSIQEKDKIIVALEKQLNSIREADGNPLHQQKIADMESDILDLEQRLSDKSKELRITQQKYNDHLNHLTKQLAASKEHNEQSSAQVNHQEIIDKIKAELDTKSIENQQLSEQLRITRSQLEHGSAGDESLISEIQTLRSELAARQAQIENLESGAENSTPLSTIGLDTESINFLLDFHGRLLDISEQQINLEWLIETQEQFVQILQKFNIQTFDSIGESVDETRHQVVELVYSTEHQHNMVFRELRKGFVHGNEIFQKASIVATRNPAHCHSCGFESSKQSKFCSQCGVRLEMEQTDGIDPVVKPMNDNENARSYLELAQSYLRRREFNQAEQAILKSRSLNPECVVSVVEHARIMESRGDFDVAREMVTEFKQKFGKSTSIDRCMERLEHKSKIIDLLRELH